MATQTAHHVVEVVNRETRRPPRARTIADPVRMISCQRQDRLPSRHGQRAKLPASSHPIPSPRTSLCQATMPSKSRTWTVTMAMSRMPSSTSLSRLPMRQVWTVRRPARPRSPHHHQRNRPRHREVHRHTRQLAGPPQQHHPLGGRALDRVAGRRQSPLDGGPGLACSVGWPPRASEWPPARDPIHTAGGPQLDRPTETGPYARKRDGGGLRLHGSHLGARMPETRELIWRLLSPPVRHSF
jgi:hypothetical protein